MKNKVYIFNYSESIQDPLIDEFYEIHQKFGDISSKCLCSAHAIIYVFSDNKDSKEITKPLSFYREILYIKESDFKSHLGDLLSLLDKYVGRERLVNPRQFELIQGSVVRSKVDPRLGVGIVKDIDGSQIAVLFTNGEKIYGNSLVQCHKSNLRVVTHIEEVKNESQKSNR